MSELKLIFPEPEVIMVQGRRVEIRPVRLRDFEVFGKASSSLFGLLSACSVEQLSAYGSAYSGQLAEVVARSTDLPKWRVRRLPAAVAVQLLVQIVRVNAGFFGQAQAAMAKALAGLQSPSP